ncbi:hypothetical protein LTR36_004949 [Oleoguttula mirabilis]|uniref:Nuclear envelope protein n=1 Tax=Oleoguttula mirabilis TaxID=1507867 RepID=A0AAV9JX68_9PEZI|nr:hypothetical protein LTR36_004949 [Oleoguttula mirabilis]
MATRTTTLQRGTFLTSNMPILPPPVAAPLARPYKDFLTPALHRRFTNAAFLTLALCWLEATFMSSSPSWLWFWFPLGMTGLRTLLLFIPCLAVFIVRVMNMHVGKRTTTSGFETLAQKATDWRSGATVGWYVFSAWLFGEVYIWSRSETANLGWIDPGRAYERPRANENPVFLRCLFFVLAIVQACWHLRSDKDTLAIAKQVGASQQNSRVPESLRQLSAEAGSIVKRAIPFTLSGTVFSLPAYFFVLRRPAWNYMAYPLARTLVRQLPANAGPSGLLHPMTLALQAVTSSAMLIILWEVSNTIFTISVSQLPLKKGQPLTSEIKDAAGTILSKSKDPNGSLIRGFKAKNKNSKSFAFWELYLICTRFEARRKTIFTEVDRKPESTWAAVSSICLAEITAISTRIKTAQEPTEYQKQTAESALQRQQQEHLIAQQREQAFGLPKIANQKVQNDRDVFAKRRQGGDVAQTVGNLAKSIGQSPGAANPVTPRARRAIAWTEQQTGGRERWGIEGMSKRTNGYAIDFLKTSLGEPFRQTFSRRVCAVIFGVPHSNKINILHASKALTALAVCSLKEDDFGQAARDIPTIIRAYTATITEITKFLNELTKHWTDVYFNNTDRDVPEVLEVVGVLRTGLEEVVLAFGEYASALGVSAKEMREAQEAVGRRAGGGG